MIINKHSIPRLKYDFARKKPVITYKNKKADPLNYTNESDLSSICSNNRIFMVKAIHYNVFYNVPIQDYIESHILQAIKNKELILGVDSSMEADYRMVDAMYYLSNTYNIPESQLFLVSNSDDLKTYMLENYKNPIIIETYEYWEKWFITRTKEAPKDYVKPTTYNKKFLCCNYRLRPHRTALLHLLYKNDLLNQGYVSAVSLQENSSIVATNCTVDVHEEARQVFPSLQNDLIYDNQISEMLPLRLDAYRSQEIWYNDMAIDTLEHFYSNTFFTVVPETWFTNQFPRFFTEKSMKPMLYFHPFIICSSYNFLKYIRNKGYKTFNGFINEEYDEIKDDSQRLLAIVTEIKRLCSFTDEEIRKFNDSVYDILDYNRKLLLTKKSFIY